MDILSLFNGHTHYWGIPHLSETDKRLIQICYECGAHRKVKANLQPSLDSKPGGLTSGSSSSVDGKRAA
jgi:hypothetical protein